MSKIFSWVGNGDFPLFSFMLEVVMATDYAVKIPTILLEYLYHFSAIHIVQLLLLFNYV